ncbi:MAG TPA: DUF3048 domain-containing protein [Terrimesophilobacter sp.]|uniref:DUF3048 domain-containing protein n=1 Tax=Terrimesophilobacter sp. TaxID=2906435 RepID=UPI002F95E1D7
MAVLTGALSVSGCAVAPVPTPTPTPAYVSSYETPAPTELAPLRGTTIPAGSLAHASIAAKVDNHWDARPQVGLERTDLVFEELVEGGITRYVAIWQSDIPELLGPVRSIRPMDPDIVSPFGGIICYSGGQQRFVALMRQTPVYNAIHGQADTEATFFRTKDKAAPHNVLVKAQAVLAQHKEIAPPAQQFAYSLDIAGSTAAKDGKPTSVVNYRFSSGFYGTWSYDPARQLFLRAQQGKKDLDSGGAQLSATNVVVLRVGVVNDGGVPKTQLSGSGEAWVSTGGATVHGTWSKANARSPIRLVDDNGVTIRLAAGNSWIELVPHAGAVSFTAAPAR